jgi:uncharacterized protein HemX
MTRLSSMLIVAFLAIGIAGGTLAQQPQTDPEPGATGAEPAAKQKKKTTKEEREKARQEKRAAKKAAATKMTPEERAALRAKRQDCRTQGKQDKLKGRKLRAFVRTCMKD